MKSDDDALSGEERAELTEADSELATRVAAGLTDDEIATQLKIPKHGVAEQIARLLAKIGARDRLEILLYAYSHPTIYKRISTGIKSSSEIGPSVDPAVDRKAS